MQVQESVEEVENSGFLATSSTLDVKLMANNKILQVHTLATISGNGVRFFLRLTWYRCHLRVSRIFEYHTDEADQGGL